MEISKKTFDELEKAGWYKDRKIDITENIKFLEEKGFEVFESAIKFMEEFGELHLEIEKVWPDGSIEVTKHNTCIKEIVGVSDSSRFGLDEYMDHDDKFIEEKVMPIGILSDEVTLYISESGKFYKSFGWIGDNTWEALDNVICQKRGRLWKEIRYK